MLAKKVFFQHEFLTTCLDDPIGVCLCGPATWLAIANQRVKGKHPLLLAGTN